jgi:caa(3)-type oxidase subunit IV
MTEEHDDSIYIKTWAILVVLLVISVLGPLLEIQWLTLATAFGIALVKAFLVATRFMHIDHAPKFVTYIMVTCLVFMLLLFAGSAPDVMKSEGSNWVKADSWHYVPEAAHHDGPSASGH